MNLPKKVIPEEASSMGTCSDNMSDNMPGFSQDEDWGPYSVPGTTRRRTIPEQYEDICQFGYDIGLTGWKFLEIVRKNDAYFLVYWGDNEAPEKVRKITPREVAYIPQSEEHLKQIFKGLSTLVGLSTGASLRAESDLSLLASELDRLIELHKRIDSISGGILPRFLMKRQEDGILFLKERVYDLVEILMLNRAMGDQLKEYIKP
jgi:hypothetical protein